MKLIASSIVAVAALAGAAQADMVGNYFILPNNVPGVQRHIDVQQGIDGGIVTGLVASTLGPNGMPVATALAMTRNTGSGNIENLNANNEILWWTAGGTGNRHVIFEKTQVDGTFINRPSNFFPDGRTSNNYGFRAVHWTGSFFVNAGDIAALTMSLDADDDAWLFINGQLAVDNGGVKATGHVSNLISHASIVAGWNTIDLFFADRHEVQSGIVFRTNANIVPTPGAAALLGLGGLAARRRRR